MNNKQIKEFHVILTNEPYDKMGHMIDKMAQDIISGRRILFPTNQGTLYKTRVEAQLITVLEHKYNFKKKINVDYYKRTEPFDEKKFKKTNLLFIKLPIAFNDNFYKYLDYAPFDYNIYLADLYDAKFFYDLSMLFRHRDLFIYMFLNKFDADGNDLNIETLHPLNFERVDEELKFYNDVLDLCNRMLKIHSKAELDANKLISDFILQNKFIKFNKIENKYYVNEGLFYDEYYNRKHAEYQLQLPVLIPEIKQYGYIYSTEDKGTYRPSKEELTANS